MISPFVRPVRRAAAGVACAALLTGMVGCTSDTNSTPEPSPLPGATTGAAPTLVAKPVPMMVRVARVSGRLRKSSQASLERNIARTISGYWDAAYLGGEYPRSDFDESFRAFSGGVEGVRHDDRSFLTNSNLGQSTQSVAAEEKKAWLAVLAPNKVAAGVTARIRLVYVADRGEAPAQRVTISGRLLLTRKKSGGWEIFGYDVTRSAGPAENGASR